MASTKDMTLLPREDCWLRERQSDWEAKVKLGKWRLFLTSPRLRGEVGDSASAMAPGEGVPDTLRSQLVERAPHPDPLRASFARLDPARAGRGRARRRLTSRPSYRPHPPRS